VNMHPFVEDKISATFKLFSTIYCGRIFLVDKYGSLVREWTPFAPSAKSVFLTEDDGSLVHMPALPAVDKEAEDAFPGDLYDDCAQGITITSWEDEETFSCNLYSKGERGTTPFCLHHDLMQLPNKNFLSLMWRKMDKDACVAKGLDPEGAHFQELDSCWDDGVVEIKTSGTDKCEVVWEWWMSDHTAQDINPNQGAYVESVHEHPELIDANYIYNVFNLQPQFGHFNTAKYNEKLDQIVISSYTHSEVYIIDHGITTEEAAGHTAGRYGKGGDLLFRWGNPNTYGRDLSIKEPMEDELENGNKLYSGPTDHQKIFALHNAQWVPEGHPGAGNLLLYNNGIMRNLEHGSNFTWESTVSSKFGVGSVDEVGLPVDEEGRYSMDFFGPDKGFFGPEDHATRILQDGLFSLSFGGAQRLKNGNTVMTFPGNVDYDVGFKIVEVTPDGEVVSNFEDPWTQFGWYQMVYRSELYEADFPGFDGKDLTPGSGRQDTYINTD